VRGGQKATGLLNCEDSRVVEDATSLMIRFFAFRALFILLEGFGERGMNKKVDPH